MHSLSLGRNEMRVLKIGLIGVGVSTLIPVGIVVWFFLSGSIFGECETKELVRRKSPSGGYEAMIYTKDCGATTRVSTIVALRKDVSGGNSQDILIMNAAGDVGVEWLSPDRLSITLPEGTAGANVFRKEMQWQAVSIEYD